jgi:hypothetical protein
MNKSTPYRRIIGSLEEMKQSDNFDHILNEFENNEFVSLLLALRDKIELLQLNHRRKKEIRRQIWEDVRIILSELQSSLENDNQYSAELRDYFRNFSLLAGTGISDFQDILSDLKTYEETDKDFLCEDIDTAFEKLRDHIIHPVLDALSLPDNRFVERNRQLKKILLDNFKIVTPFINDTPSIFEGIFEEIVYDWKQSLGKYLKPWCELSIALEKGDEFKAKEHLEKFRQQANAPAFLYILNWLFMRYDIQGILKEIRLSGKNKSMGRFFSKFSFYLMLFLISPFLLSAAGSLITNYFTIPESKMNLIIMDICNFPFVIVLLSTYLISLFIGGLILFSFMRGVMFTEKSVENTFYNNIKGFRINLFLPSLLGAILIGLFPLVLTSDAWNLTVLLADSKLLLAAILTASAVFSYILGDVKRKLTQESWDVVIIRAKTIFAIASIEAFAATLVVCDICGKALSLQYFDKLHDPVFLGIPKLISWPQSFRFFYEFNVFPSTLLLWTFLSLFFGVFMEIIWGGKKITQTDVDLE